MTLDLRQRVRMDHHIGIQKKQNVTLGLSHAQISSPGWSDGLWALADNYDAKLCCHLSRIIHGSIVDHDQFVCGPGDPHYISSRIADKQSYLRVAEPFADGAERGQAEDNIAKLPKINDEDIFKTKIDALKTLFQS